ncbi:NUDIX domain-containing protein [Aureibaculum marinum]|uniref:NUDIX domain-containing protein n=1 Tax=Aureibaculum marinum TaxID=2487930 RepID=A0A3N4NUU5_9FLAO|nr:NUDIX domain-containing protein [Aureibaculum marinum]RPD99535.1 NUDIX domain-containing protein [Aureibaculum marinum]
MKSVFFNNHVIYLVTNLKYEIEKNFFHIKNVDIMLILSTIEKNTSDSIYLYHNNFEDLWEHFTSYFVVIEAGGGKVVNDKKEVLFIYRNNKWDLPKGKIEKNETIKNAALREVEEETGIENLSIVEPLPITYHIYKHKKKYVLKVSYWFKMFSDFKGKLVPQQEESITRVEWLNNLQIKEALTNTYENIKLLFKSNYI